jgi:hypothetical protein
LQNRNSGIDKALPKGGILNVRKILLSVNENLVDKHVGGPKRYFREGFESRELSVRALADSINQGFAFSVQYDGGIRKGTNYVCAGFLAIDSDGGISLADALAHPYIQQYGTIFYTTASHGEDGKDKFRVVFATETPIDSGPRFALAMLGLAEKLNTDRSIADDARILFGSKGSLPTILGGFLPDSEVKALVKQGRAAHRAAKTAEITNEDAPESERLPDFPENAPKGVPATLPIRLAGGGSLPFTEIPRNAPIFCPFHSDDSPSAFTLRSEQGVPAIHCKACRKTWFLEGTKPPPTYNFYEFDDIVERTARSLAATNAKLKAAGKPASNKSAVIISERFLPELDLQEGITLVKSPKGTGKTTALKELVKKAKQNGLSVLLLGHRQTLLRELSLKLGLKCYLDHPAKVVTPDGKLRGNKPPDHFACSVDSLLTKLRSTRHYDLVIIDESEQVFSHITARTIRDAQAVMTILHHYVTNAPSIYLFDADLNRVTMHFVIPSRGGNPKQPVRMILNKYVSDNRVCELFAKPTALVADMVQNARSGKRLFVACNSKSRAQVFAKMLRKDVGDDLKVLLITAEDKISDEVQDFLTDVPTKILQYDVVVASPAIGTGIDITFPDGAAEIDVVYGFFISGINSHYDVDQQIGRVRNPKQVKVWISGKRNHFVTDLEAVKLDIVQTGDFHQAITGFKDTLPVVNMAHPLLTLQATAYCAQRASQNALKDLFIRHKERNGWKIVSINAESKEAKVINEKMKVLKGEIAEETRKGILAAGNITEEQWKEYFDRRAEGKAIGQAALFEMLKFELANFYNQDVTDDLIRLDGAGKYRECVIMFGKTHLGVPSYVSTLVDKWSMGTFFLGERLGEVPLRCLEGAILSAGLLGDAELDPNKIVTKADLDRFLAFCDERRVTIERDLGITLRKDRARDPVKTLNLFLELIGLEMRPVGKSKKKGAAIYRYQLSKPGLNTLIKIIDARRNGKPRSDLPERLDPPKPRRKSAAGPQLQASPDDPFAAFG